MRTHNGVGIKAACILGLGAPWQRLLRPLYPVLSFRQEIGRAPQPVWAQWRLERSRRLLLPQNEPRLVFSPARNLVTGPTELSYRVWQKFTDVSRQSTSLNFCQTTRGHSPEDILNRHRWEKSTSNVTVLNISWGYVEHKEVLHRVTEEINIVLQ
jgi:hypothetical protein